MSADDFRASYHAIYSQDAPPQKPYGWIQYKGTDVCIDLHCTCGTHGHIDGEFVYRVKCNDCGAVYAIGQVVRLIPLTKEQAEESDTTIYLFSENNDHEAPNAG